MKARTESNVLEQNALISFRQKNATELTMLACRQKRA